MIQKITQNLSILSLMMMTVVSVDSVRNLPALSIFGSHLFIFFLIGAVFFLIPVAFVSAELVSTCPNEGGIYAWVGSAFGQRMGFMAIWFQWIENVIWYPTILSFVAGTLAYIFFPHQLHSKVFLVCAILIIFWTMTAFNVLGIRFAAVLSHISAWFGLLIPMMLIISLGIWWVCGGHPVYIDWHAHQDWNQLGFWVALTGVMLSFCGMEITTVHSHDVYNPRRAYPRALFGAALIILITLFFGSLAIACVIPKSEISLVSGIIQAFDLFLSAHHLSACLPWVALMLIIGALGAVSNWVIAPTRGLMCAFAHYQAPAWLTRCNAHGAPVALMCIQAVVVSAVALVFLLLPHVNGSYWFLTTLAAQAYMLMYLMMFAAAIVLRYRDRDRVGFRIPGGLLGIWCVSGAGFLGSFCTWAVGFVPPSFVTIGRIMRYETLLCVGLLFMILTPCLIILYLSKSHTKTRHCKRICVD